MNKYEKLFKDVTGFDFERYYNEHKPSLTWFLAKNYTKDIDKAEDFVNQAFMQSLEKIETYNKEKSLFKTWLTKIAINLVIKEWKDSHKYNFISLERDTLDAPSILNILPSDNNSYEYESDYENKKKCEIIFDIIENLPDKYKKVMIMRELNHMAYKDIAESIKKDTKIILKNQDLKLDNPEDFFNLEIYNKGDKSLKITYISNDYRKDIIVESNMNLCISRDDFQCEKKFNDIFIIDSNNTECEGKYITTTNLSTIKSQIKKGRELIQKKVKKRFDKISENGVKDFFN